MDREKVILALAALAQPTRLVAFQLLVTHEPDGLAAGEIARRMAVPHNTMSAHLSSLSRAGLVRAERQSRSIIYRASLVRFRDLVAYLLQNCCGGDPNTGGPLAAALPLCSPRKDIADA